MAEPSSEFLNKSRLTSLRSVWSQPDENKGRTWEFDGVPKEQTDSDGYNHELRDGLAEFGCSTFDDLVVNITGKLGRKPVVVDLMGGAYFLDKPENTEMFVGIRIHDKDDDFLRVHKGYDRPYDKKVVRIISAKNRRVIEADILSNKGWQKIQRENKKPADIMVCRPVGPFDVRHAIPGYKDSTAAYAGLYKSLFERMLGLVNKKEGIVFTEAPDVYTDEELAKFFGDADRKNGTRTKIFTVRDKDYQWSGYKRRYAVVVFEK